MTDDASPETGRRSYRAARLRRSLRPVPYLISPIGMLTVFFVAPLAILIVMSFRHQTLYGSATGFTLDNFRALISSPLYRRVAFDTIIIATVAMVVQLILAVPTAYVMAFRAGKFSCPYCSPSSSPTNSTPSSGFTPGGCSSAAKG